METSMSILIEPVNQQLRKSIDKHCGSKSKFIYNAVKTRDESIFSTYYDDKLFIFVNSYLLRTILNLKSW